MARGKRAPARKRGVLYGKAPLAMADATGGEVVMAIASLALDAGVVVGRGWGYDSLRDEYTVLGKSKATGKAQDFKIAGEAVASVIAMARILNGGKFINRIMGAA